MSRRRLLLAGALLLAALVLGGGGVDLWVEWQWFRSVGYERRFWVLTAVRLGAWATIFGVATVSVYGLLRWISGKGGPLQIRRRLGDLEISEALPEDWVKWVVRGGAVVIGLLVAAPVADSLGYRALAAAHSEPWGTGDAILGRDPRLYVFLLPLFRSLWSVTVSWLVWTSLAVGAFFLLTGDVRIAEERAEVSPTARRVLAWLGAGLLLLLACHFYLSVFEVVSEGPITYVEATVELTARRVLGVLALLAAAAVAYSERVRRWRLSLTLLALLVVAWPVGLGVIPDLAQRFRVEPNEFQLERPYLEANVQATRRGYRLDEIRETEYPAREDEPPSMAAVRRWTRGLPLWDERPLLATYNQLQGLLAYHRFPDVDNDRYGEGEERKQVAVAVREFAPDLLDPSARTWQNLHLRYTHGTGVVATPVDSVAAGGAPVYHLRDIPPRRSPAAPASIEVEEPRVYFGELTSEYAIEPPDTLPGGRGTTGVPLDGLLKKAAFAWGLGSTNILLHQPTGPAPLLIWRRTVVDRVRSVAPFLLVDPDPYAIVHEGRVKWIVEGYTSTSRYPLSEPAGFVNRRVNYLRGAVKAVVDGTTGHVSLYTVRPEDPVLAAWRSAFPGLFRPVDEMPESLRDHLRYPHSLLRVQADLLNAYHMKDPEVFYRKQDLWSVGQETYRGDVSPVEPYYLLMPFPGAGEGDEGAAEFLLTVPFTPRDRDNLSAFILARNDPPHYGELWLFEVETTEQVFGPRQIEVQIDQDPRISEQLSLWRQLGSEAVRGHLLLVPVEGFLLYVEPLFLVAEDETGAAPGLKRVIAAAGDHVAMAETLDGALRALMASLGADVEPPAPVLPAVDTLEEEQRAAGAPPRPEGSPEAGSSAQLRRVRELVRRAEEALQAGDLARFADLWSQIRRSAAAAEAGGDTTTRRP